MQGALHSIARQEGDRDNQSIDDLQDLQDLAIMGPQGEKPVRA
jgi:hypothetical protein